MSRVFTAEIPTPEIVATGAASAYFLAQGAFVPQEDIEVIGAELAIWMNAASENDGRSRCEVEISQSAVWAQAGSILRGEALEYWNTAPAFGYAVFFSETVMFPKGQTIPVSEGTTLYTNAATNGKSAGSSHWNVAAIIYYIKKGT